MADTPTAAERIVNAQPVEATRHTAPAEGGFGPVGKSQDTGEKSVPKKVVKGYEIKEGGSDKNILLEPKLRESIVGSLRDRLSISRSLQREGRPLSAIDMMLLSHGEQAIRGMEQNNFSLQDISISRFAVYDDLIQKSLATAQIIQDNKLDLHPGLKKLPLLGKLFDKTAVDVQVAGRGQKFSTEYTRALHLETRSPEKIQNNLLELNSIRRGINESLSVADPLFDEDPPSTHSGGDRSKFHYAVLDQLDGPEGVMQQKFGGKSYAELWMENPAAATEALYEANQRALTEFAREAAKEILINQKPKADTNVIEVQAKKLEAKPTPEDISVATKKAEDARAEFTEAETKFIKLNPPVKDATEAVRQSQIAFDDLKAQYTSMENANKPLIADLQKQIAEIISRSPLADPNLKGDQKLYQQALIVESNKNIAALQQEVLKLQQETKNLLMQYSRAESDLIRKTADHADKLVKANAAGLPAAETEYNSKKTAKETADKELKLKQAAAQSEATPENKEKATALREWVKVHGKYQVIVDSSLDQPHDSEFTRERVARIGIVKGQIEGAERIREQIFRQTNPTDYNPALARKMLSDETIARAIIRTYNILPNNPKIVGKKGRDLLLAVLPSVRNEQFKLGDTLRFIMHEGLKSAEKGNPYLTLSPYFAETQAELKPTIEDTASKEVGTTKIVGRILTWEGNVLFSNAFPNNPAHIKVEQDIKGANIKYRISVKATPQFIQLLPDDINPSLPTSVNNLFYRNGHLRTDLTPAAEKRAEWMLLESGTANDNVSAAGITVTRAADKLLDAIGNNFEQAPTMIRRATVNYVLSQSPAERLKILKGLASDIQVSAPEGNFSINFDNYGNFTIKTPEMGAAQELRAFERQLEQAGQQELLATIQSTLGEEIILAQQRR